MGDGDNGGDDPGQGTGDPGQGTGDPGLEEGGDGLHGLVIAVVLFGLASLFLGLLIAPGGPGNQAWRDAQEAQEVQTNRARAHTLIVTAVYAFALAILLSWAQPPSRVAGAVDELADAEALCTNCFNVLPPGVVFCPYCGAPASVLATHGGIEYVYAQAWCLGRAAHGPNRPLQVVGMALITSPYAIFVSPWVVSAGMLSLTASGLRELLMNFGLGFGGGMGVAQGLFWLLLYGFILVRCAANLDSDDPDQLDPARGPYGSPPWWSFDTRQVPPESHEPVG